MALAAAASSSQAIMLCGMADWLAGWLPQVGSWAAAAETHEFRAELRDSSRRSHATYQDLLREVSGAAWLHL